MDAMDTQITDTQTAADWLPVAPWRGRVVSIVNIHPLGSIEQAHTITGKREILRQASEGDRLLVLWHGEWRTDARLITEAQAASILERLA